jgi:hypothetical protein
MLSLTPGARPMASFIIIMGEISQYRIVPICHGSIKLSVVDENKVIDAMPWKIVINRILDKALHNKY